MSYCRWSSDHFECDVYVYADISGGWTTHVAGRRRKVVLPDSIKAMFPKDEDLVNDAAFEALEAAEEAQQAFFDSQPCDELKCQEAQPDGTTKPGVIRVLKDSQYLDLASIGEEAGQTFSDPTPGECAVRLEALKLKGFNVPQYAIDALRAEQAELGLES